MNQLIIGESAPDALFTTLDGEQITLSSLQGQPVLLNFLTTNCTWCRTEMLSLSQVYKRTDNVQIKILGVVVGQDTAGAAQFAAEQNLGVEIVVDESGASRSAFQLERVPTLVFIDAAGKIACVYQGATEQLAGIVEQTILAIAGEQELPEYSLVGNGCGLND